MECRQVLCLALVVMTMAPAFGGLTKDPLEAISSAAGKHGDTTVSGMANPSTPPTAEATASGESHTLLYGAAVDVNIRKVPIVTMSDAPCKNICKNECKLELTKSCSTVPVVTKECNPSTKTLTKKVCSKKCALSFETPKIIKSISVDTPSNPNPSTPPTYANPSTPPAVASTTADSKVHTLNFHKDSPFNKLDGSSEADLSVSAHGKGRRLSAAKLQLLKGLPVPSCDEVCDEVHFQVPDLECQMVTHQVEMCKMVPSKKCQEECVCIPQKSIAVNLPHKALDVSVNKP